MDKLTVLNRALGATGNNKLAALNDGTEEWDAADEAFGRAIDDLISRHNWPFAQTSGALVEASDADNRSLRFDHAFALPADVIHLLSVWADGVETKDYEVVGRFICLDCEGVVEIEGYAMPADVAWHPQAAEILTQLVEVGLLRGLNEDFVEARNREMAAEQRLIEARPRVSGENPARNAYRSRIAEARYRRRGG